MSNIIDKIQLSGVTYDIGGQGGSGVSVVEVTQAEYDALPSSAKTDTSKMYVITDAEAGDLSQYWTSAQTNSAITQAVSGKQDTLVSGTNIKTINNESILGSGNIDIQGGGGKAVSGGTNISITTGETADTINCTLPITAGTGENSIVGNIAQNTASGKNALALGGFYNSQTSYGLSVASGLGSVSFGGNASGEQSFAAASMGSTASGQRSATIAGYSNNSKGVESLTSGRYVNAENIWEFSFGYANVSHKASNTWGDSGNTLFSVGNGTSASARHNAFEIRQNGDIYLTSGSTDIKLQDHLGGGGGGGVNVVQTTGTSTTDVMSQDAVTTQLNGKADKATAARGITYGSKNTHSVIKLTNQTGQTISGYYYILSLSKINGKDIVTQGDANPNTFSLVETSAITTSVTSASTDSQVPSAKAVYDQLGGLKLVKLSQSAYDALSPNYDSNTLYVIVN